jgi:hypothetical protein
MPGVVLADWREEYAYTLGLQAYIYGIPWVFLPQLRWQWVTQPVNPEKTPYASLGRFWHMKALADAQYRDGGFPNNDTLYSVAWVDVRRGPVILSHPDMGDRYFAFELASLDSDNFAYVGTRTTGQRAGYYAIVGAGWHGTLPDGVATLERTRTPSVLILGRTQVDGPADVANVRVLQAQYRLTSLARWGLPPTRAAEDHHAWRPFDPKVDPLAAWKTMNRAMTEEPPETRHAALLKLFATIGVGPGQRVDRMPAATKRGLARAAAVGPKLLAAALDASLGKRVNGWQYPPPTIGRAGLHDDFLTRAALQCATGMIANDPDEALFLSAGTDGEGRPLSGTMRYSLHFAPDGLPPVGAFWSLTMYGPDHNLVDNPLDRYSIGSRTPALRRDADGGLTIYVQHVKPEGDWISNWLPAPAGPFNLILRLYLPAREIVEQTWQPPEIAQSVLAAVG